MSLLPTAPPVPALSPDHLHRALQLRDLTDPAQGEHAVQQLLADVTTALTRAWSAPARVIRESPVVAVRDNYDRLGYAPDDVTRDRRHTQYLSSTTMLRSHTSAQIPHALQAYAHPDAPTDELLVVPGLVYRRDVVDRTHVGEPHQVDLWRVRSAPHPPATASDLQEMLGLLVDAVLPGARWRTTPAEHPYPVQGRQLDVLHDGRWMELAECRLIHPDVLRGSGLDPRRWSGLALGMGLDRALMLRKGIPDIRYLRSRDPRALAQLQDLEPWRPVSVMPPVRRDLSVVLDADTDDEQVGDLVRAALRQRAGDLESVTVHGRTDAAALPAAARERLGIDPGQVNALVRLLIRPLDRTLTAAEANVLRNDVYRALHRGRRAELIGGGPLDSAP